MKREILERCKLCNRELTDPEAQRRGVGPECYEKFARNILVVSSWGLSADDASDLIEHHGYDLVVRREDPLEQTDDSDYGDAVLYFKTEHPPFFHMLPLLTAWGGGFEEKIAACSTPVEAILALANMIGFVGGEGLDYAGNPEFAGKDSFDGHLVDLHKLTVEPGWTIMFTGTATLGNLRFSPESIGPLSQEIYLKWQDDLWQPTYYGFTRGERGWDLYARVRQAFGRNIAAEFEEMFRTAEESAWNDDRIRLPTDAKHLPETLVADYNLDPSAMLEGNFCGVYAEDCNAFCRGDPWVNDLANPLCGAEILAKAFDEGKGPQLSMAEVEERVQEAGLANPDETEFPRKTTEEWLAQLDWLGPYTTEWQNTTQQTIKAFLNHYAKQGSSHLLNQK